MDDRVLSGKLGLVNRRVLLVLLCVATAFVGCSRAQSNASNPPGRAVRRPSVAPHRQRSQRAAPHAQNPQLYVVAQLNRSDRSDRSARLALMRRFGFAGTRLAFEWRHIEPKRGVFHWERQDGIVAALQSAGFRAYGLLVYSPVWARPPGMTASHRPIVDGSSARGDSLFAAFAGAAAKHYRGKIDRWEIWNEPNLPNFWVHLRDGRNLGPDPRDYLSLYKAARAAILAANPSAQVAVGGLASGRGVFRNKRDPVTGHGRLRVEPAYAFLHDLLRLGLRPDFVALHPYSDLPPGARSKSASAPEFPNLVFDKVVSVLDQGGLSRTRIWVTEWGVNQTPARSNSVVRSWFRRALTTLRCNRRVAFVTIYELRDKAHRGGYSLVAPSGELTASGRALSNYVRSPPACP